jgi:rare lipoprotein A
MKQLEGFIWCLAVLVALSFGIYAGHKVTRAIADTEIMDVQAVLEVAQASLAEANIEMDQSRVLAQVWTGLASFYGKSHHGKLTASGSRFDMNAYTAAHRTLPFGSLVLVLDVERATWTLVEVTDRGPAAWTGREIDLSRAAARQLGMEQDGVTPVVMLTVNGRAGEGD